MTRVLRLPSATGDPAPISKNVCDQLGKQWGLSHNNAPIPENNCRLKGAYEMRGLERCRSTVGNKENKLNKFLTEDNNAPYSLRNQRHFALPKWKKDRFKNTISIPPSVRPSIYFRFSGSSLLLTYFPYGLNYCSHYDEEWQKPIRYATIRCRSAAWRSFAPLQKSRRNHRSYIWYGFRAARRKSYPV